MVGGRCAGTMPKGRTMTTSRMCFTGGRMGDGVPCGHSARGPFNRSVLGSMSRGMGSCYAVATGGKSGESSSLPSGVADTTGGGDHVTTPPAADENAWRARLESKLDFALGDGAVGDDLGKLTKTLTYVTNVLRRRSPSDAKKMYRKSASLLKVWGVAKDRLVAMDQQSLSDVLYASTQAKFMKAAPELHSTEFIQTIEDQLVGQIDKMSVKNFVSIVRSLSSIKYSPSVEFQEEFTRYLLLRLSQFAVDDLYTVLVNADHIPRMRLKKHLLAQCMNHIIRHVSDLSGNQLSDILVILAFNNFIPAERDMVVLEERLAETSLTPDAVNGRAIMRMLKAYAKFGIGMHDDMLKKLAALFEQRSVPLNVHTASRAVFFFARMRQYPRNETLDELCRIIDASAEKLSAKPEGKTVAGLLWGLGKIQYRPEPGFVRKLVAQTLPNLNVMTGSQLTQLMYGIALLGETLEEDAMRLLCAQVVEKLQSAEELPVRNLSLVLWSLTVMRAWEAGAQEHMEALWLMAVGIRRDDPSLHFQARSALEAASTCTLYERTEIDVPSHWRVDSPPSVGGEAGGAGASEGGAASAKESLDLDLVEEEEGIQEASITSAAQLELDHTLREMGIDARTSHVQTTQWSADFYVPSTKVAIEFDGPSHFYHNTLELSAKSKFRNRIHQAKGWDVVTIPHFEWQQFEEMEDRMAYVKEMLEADTQTY